MKIENLTPILNVANIPASLAWFESLWWGRGFTWNEHGGIENDVDRNAHGDATFASVCGIRMGIRFESAPGRKAIEWVSRVVDSSLEWAVMRIDRIA